MNSKYDEKIGRRLRNGMLKSASKAEETNEKLPKMTLSYIEKLAKPNLNYIEKLFYTSIIIVPATKNTSPVAAFLERCSLKTMAEKAIETSMLNLSIGTTALAGPDCKARK